MATGNSITITRVANGFALEMPRPFPDHYMRDPKPADVEFAETLRGVLPMIKEIVKMQHADPELERIREENADQEDPQLDPELDSPPDIMGVDVYTHVFATWDGLVDYLANLVI